MGKTRTWFSFVWLAAIVLLMGLPSRAQAETKGGFKLPPAALARFNAVEKKMKSGKHRFKAGTAMFKFKIEDLARTVPPSDLAEVAKAHSRDAGPKLKKLGKLKFKLAGFGKSKAKSASKPKRLGRKFKGLRGLKGAKGEPNVQAAEKGRTKPASGKKPKGGFAPKVASVATEDKEISVRGKGAAATIESVEADSSAVYEGESILRLDTRNIKVFDMKNEKVIIGVQLWNDGQWLDNWTELGTVVPPYANSLLATGPSAGYLLEDLPPTENLWACVWVLHGKTYGVLGRQCAGPIAITDDGTPEPAAEAESDGCSASATAFNWRDAAGLTKVRDQKTCGSCWAFTGVSAFEGAWRVAHGEELDLSEQFMLDCAKTKSGKKSGSCGGGWYGGVFDTFQSQGPPAEGKYPYKSKEGACTGGGSSTGPKAALWGYVREDASRPSVSEMKRALCDNGPLASTVYASDMFIAYQGGVFDEKPDVDANQVNHGITLVGWDDKKGAYLIKNSWGTVWGEDGFGWVSYDAANIGFGSAWVRAQ
ncbi:MAG: hypothetical protein EXR75_09485 [Myxococcales bacterium]|nr:hypothetical protein [Myxococcales bacterium]